MNELKIFNNPDFGDIRTLEEAIQQLQSSGAELLAKKLTEAAVLDRNEVIK